MEVLNQFEGEKINGLSVERFADGVIDTGRSDLQAWVGYPRTLDFDALVLAEKQGRPNSYPIKLISVGDVIVAQPDIKLPHQLQPRTTIIDEFYYSLSR